MLKVQMTSFHNILATHECEHEDAINMSDAESVSLQCKLKNHLFYTKNHLSFQEATERTVHILGEVWRAEIDVEQEP